MIKVTLAFTSAIMALSSAARVVCYFPTWAIYRPNHGKFQARNIDLNVCTHILYAYVGIFENGGVMVLDDWEATLLEEIDKLMSLKQQNPNLKIILSMGGWNEGSEKYSHVAADPTRRSTLVESVLDYVDKHGFDIDWEYPGQRGGDPNNDQANFVTLLDELKNALNAKGLILSAAVAGDALSMDISYPDVKAVSDNVDLINVMNFNTSELQEFNFTAQIRRWLDKGADPSKIQAGVGTYELSFISEDDDTAEQCTPLEGILGYNEICLLDAAWKYVWDHRRQVPYKICGSQGIVYEDAKSVGIKTDFSKELKLGGIVVWSINTDDFFGECEDDDYPLLKAINDHLY